MKVYLGMGSNLGDRKGNLDRAVELLSDRVRIEQLSSIYETEPVGSSEQPRFLNAVLEVSTGLGPFQLLSVVKGIEVVLGRVPGRPNAPRPIDIDILFYEDQVIDTPSLTVPHPRPSERAFVLIPLAELAPDLVHPVSGRAIKELAAAQGQEGVERWNENV